VLFAFFFSRQVYFTDILPEGDNTKGVYTVLESTCGQVFTYEISGPKARYLGSGDLHDTTYNHLEVSTGFGAFLGVEEGNILDHRHHCSYNVRVYPSKEIEDYYHTDTPVIFTVVLVCAFAFTSLVFIVYDRLVEQRQMVVLDTAVKSTNVVESLFPAQVRDGLYNASNKNQPKANERVINKGVDAHYLVDEGEEGDDIGCSPNAHAYEECTVFFADIAGFTAWSSTRQPAEVFKLLESFYGVSHD
jgi:hypothetical protein